MKLQDPLLDGLMVRSRCGGQGQLSVDDLVTAVLRQEDVVVVREAERPGDAHLTLNSIVVTEAGRVRIRQIFRTGGSYIRETCADSRWWRSRPRSSVPRELRRRRKKARRWWARASSRRPSTSSAAPSRPRQHDLFQRLDSPVLSLRDLR